MSKLFKLKQWLTLLDTAKYLTSLFEEEVNEADVLQLVLNGHLKLSVNFVNHAVVRRAKWISIGEWDELMELHCTRGIPTEDTQRPVLHYENHVAPISGVWDLAMIGAETLDVQQKYQMITGGMQVKLINIDGTFVSSYDGQLYQLQTHYDDNPYANADTQEKERTKKPLYDPDNYFPSGGLPEDCVFVVRTTALREFEQSINDTPTITEKTIPTAKHANTSDKLQYLNQASLKFWANADRADRTTHPDNKTIEVWLIDHGYSTTLAAKAATIIRPEWAETGRKPDK